ncbi:MAG: hypothetical protein IT271_07800 [Chitinophagales bacterium]|nr:hypothetical protein [Chitinophagales bacterium]
MKKYLKIFLIYFSVSAFTFTIKSYFNSNISEKNENIIFGFYIALALSLFVAITYYINDRIWTPYKVGKLLQQTSFLELFQKGFIQEKSTDNNYDILQGCLSNFHVIIVFTKVGIRYSELSFLIEFHPKSNEKILSNEDLITLVSKYKKEKYLWKFHCIFHTQQYKNSELNKIISNIESAIYALKTEKIIPISKQETDSIQPEIDKLIEAKTWDSKFV